MKSGSDGALAAQVAMNTTLAAATGGITVFLLRDWAAVRHVRQEIGTLSEPSDMITKCWFYMVLRCKITIYEGKLDFNV